MLGRTKGTPAPNQGTRYPIEVLTTDEMKALLNACGHTALGIRNRAMLATLWRTGLRLREALRLQPKDVDVNQATLRILRAKGGKARTVGVDETTMTLVTAWLTIRRTFQPPASAPLFCTRDGTPLHQGYLRNLLLRLARQTNLTKRLHPHALRHTHAAELAAEGVPINVIQKQLGHTNVAVTSRYLDHIAPADLIAIMRGRQWHPTPEPPKHDAEL